ncbi:uncharacterized protein LOC117625521 [Prunus dulcis]|uniref:uncharacterized protein LOC117625521 n=1 Tax=Prunus dulcis TaxID=3755 RepID=UPI001482219E|nr:uncharacterized protein LOC117625521 [Prunus dulcis]
MHVGPVESVHNKAREATTHLMNQNTHMETAMSKHSDEARKAYHTCLIASIKCTKFLLRQGLAFHGHDESATSSNMENYLELLQFLTDSDDKVREVVMENAPKNLKLIAPCIQKDLVNSCALETLDAIMDSLKDRFFSILVDEARFVGIQDVTDTISSSLKDAIDIFFSLNGMSLSKLRGQGNDGASNMKDIASFFATANSVVKHVWASCKRCDLLRGQLQAKLVVAFENDCLVTGLGLNQETSLKGSGDTRWNSHYGTLIIITSMFSSVVHVLQMVIDDNPNNSAGRSRHNARIKTNHNHYLVELCIYVIDEQIIELDNRFNEVNTELLICLACLSPKDSFIAFDKPKLLRLAQFYPQDFSDEDCLALEDLLEIYIHYVHSSSDFSQLEGIGDLARKNGGDKDASIATASVERALSVMNIIKGPFQNKMGDQWLSDSLIV